MKKKRNRKGRSEGSGGGMMMGMRRGFKNAAHSVTGQKQSKNKALDWVLTVATVLMAAYLIYKFFIK